MTSRTPIRETQKGKGSRDVNTDAANPSSCPGTGESHPLPVIEQHRLIAEFLASSPRPSAMLRSMCQIGVRIAIRAGLEDELDSVSYAALVKAAATYQPSRSAFVTHVGWAMRSGLDDLLRPFGLTAGQDKSGRRDTVSLDRLIGDGSSLKDFVAAPGDDESRERDAATESLLAAVRDHLTEQEKTVIEMRFTGCKTHKSVAKSTGLSTKEVRRIEAEAIAKLKLHTRTDDHAHEQTDPGR